MGPRVGYAVAVVNLLIYQLRRRRHGHEDSHSDSQFLGLGFGFGFGFNFSCKLISINARRKIGEGRICFFGVVKRVSRKVMFT